MKNYPSEASLIFSVPDFSLSYTISHFFYNSNWMAFLWVPWEKLFSGLITVTAGQLWYLSNFPFKGFEVGFLFFLLFFPIIPSNSCMLLYNFLPSQYFHLRLLAECFLGHHLTRYISVVRLIFLRKSGTPTS